MINFIAPHAMSLNFRIFFSASAVLVIFIALTAFALEKAFMESAEIALRNTLNSQVYALMATAEVKEQQLVMPSNELDALLGIPSSGIYAAISNSLGVVLWRSSSTLGVKLPVLNFLPSGETAFKKIMVGQVEFYRAAYGVSWQTEKSSLALTFSITTDLTTFDKQINRYRVTLWAWLMAMAVLLLLSQSMILRWGLAPLRQVAAELNLIEEGKQQQIEARYPQEIARLTGNINLLLVHERQQKKRYREAMGNLAHSLKTPLAVLQAMMETGLDPKAGHSMQEQLQRMNSIIQYQLQWAIATGGGSLGESIELLPIVTRLLTALQKVYVDKKVVVTIHVEKGLMMRVEEGDIMEVLGNLLDNAFKWANQSIEISFQQSGQALILSINDDGPGVGEVLVDKLLQRGVRVDESIAGQGIGLSIVKNIVIAYGGELMIVKSHLGGANVRIIF